MTTADDDGPGHGRLDDVDGELERFERRGQRVVRVVLDDEHDAAARLDPRPDLPSELDEHRRRRFVVDLVHRVEPQAVEAIFVDPITGVGNKELPAWPGILAVKVDRLSPVILITICEIVF